MFGEIKKGIPVPEKLRKRERIDWPFKDMEEGDSVTYGPEKFRQAQMYASVYGGQTGRKFRTQKQPDGSLTIWRIA